MVQLVYSQGNYEARIDQLMAKMTLEEKVGQMVQYSGFWEVTGPAPADGSAAKKYEHLRSGRVGSMLNVRGVKNILEIQKIAVEESRLGIPLIFGFDVIHGHRTLAPIPLAEAASWDLEAIKKSASNAAQEAASVGLNWTFAPNVDISRDPRWGRVMEGAGEDPYLGSLIAEARVKGFQGENLADPSTIASCAKHFAGYGFAEGGRDYNTVDISSYVLHNTVLPPFKAAVQAGVRTFMNGFHVLNGVPVTADTYLQRQLLKEEWGFNGFIISDWSSIMELTLHGYAENLEHACELAVNAGSDMDMEGYAYIDHLQKLVENGTVDLRLVNDAVRRILRVKFELGLMDDPYLYCNEEREELYSMNADHLEDARDMGRKSIVLLKNEGDLLPLKAGENTVLIGALADDKTSPLGSWRIGSDDGSAVSVLEGMREVDPNLKFERGPDFFTGEVSFIRALNDNEDDWSGMDEALEAAKQADKVVLVMGEHGFQSGEARSRTKIGLPGIQQEILERVHAVNPNIILLVMSGRPLVLEWADQNIPTIAACWQLGTETGHAIADVVYGKYNPSAKLPMSFPRNEGQIPIHYGRNSTGRPIQKDGMVFWSHYTDQKNDALYPFGYGLSYTEWTYSDVDVQIDNDGHVSASVTVTNTGNREGTEIVQLYIHDRIASLVRPEKALKGFDRITLESGASQKVQFNLSRNDLGFYNNDGKWIIEPGKFDVGIGSSSRSIEWKEVELKK
ncbi:MAG: beta-glucosidase BglX [Bacteroidota bacterium]